MTTPLSTEISFSPIPAAAGEEPALFGAVLGRARSPKRRFSTGTAFAVAAHLWLVVAATTGAHAAKEPERQVEVTFYNPAPPPPPPKGGAASPNTPKPTPKPKVDPTKLKEAKVIPKPVEAEPEKTPEPEQAQADPDGEEGGVAGGQKGGVVGSTNLDGVVGGTGTSHGDPPRSGIPMTLQPAQSFTTIQLGSGTDQAAPVWLTSPAPTYPKEALAAKVEGTVLARCNAYPDGSLRDCRILKSQPFFDAAVLAHLGTVRVQPFTSGGKPVNGAVALNIPLRFKLP